VPGAGPVEYTMAKRYGLHVINSVFEYWIILLECLALQGWH